MAKRFMCDAQSYYSYLSNQYADNKENLLLKIFSKYFTCQDSKYRRSFSLNIYEREPGTKGHDTSWHHFKKYNYDELMELATELKVKRLDRKHKKDLGFNLLDLYDIVYVEAQSRVSECVKYSFLIKKSHLGNFKKISFSKKEDKFLIRNEEGYICWKLSYYKKDDYIDPYELPCMIRIF